jgi:diguanylate cyclase (GGDEF)-like protein
VPAVAAPREDRRIASPGAPAAPFPERERLRPGPPIDDRQRIAMGLRGKLVALFFIGFALTCSVGIGLLIHNLGADFAGMERDEALRLDDQLVRNFKAELEHLDELNTDWADWAGMYAFAQTLSPEFAEAEVGTGALASAKLGFVAIFDDHHRRIFLRAAADLVDQESNRGLVQTLEAMRRVFDAQGTRNTCSLHAADGEIYLLCWQDIHRSDGTGDAHGTLLMGRLLDERILQRIRNQSGLDFGIERTLADGLPVPIPAAGRAISTDALAIGGADRHMLTGRMLDASGQPVFRFHIHLPADIERSGRQITWRVVVVVAVGALLSGLVLVIGTQVLLVRPLRRMERQLRDVGAAGGWPEQIAAPPGGDEIATLGETINRMLRALREQGQALEQQSLTDPLTRLANRRAFDRALAAGVAQGRRSGAALSLLILDVDHFKAYNDLHGHPAGDAVLVALGRVLREAASRPADVAARIGGEEFALLLPDTTLDGALRVAAKVHAALRAQAIAHAGSPAGGRVTVSIGAALARPGESADAFVARADAAAYAAKNAGRDRTCAADDAAGDE